MLFSSPQGTEELACFLPTKTAMILHRYFIFYRLLPTRVHKQPGKGSSLVLPYAWANTFQTLSSSWCTAFFPLLPCKGFDFLKLSISLVLPVAELMGSSFEGTLKGV